MRQSFDVSYIYKQGGIEGAAHREWRFGLAPSKPFFQQREASFSIFSVMSVAPAQLAARHWIQMKENEIKAKAASSRSGTQSLKEVASCVCFKMKKRNTHLCVFRQTVFCGLTHFQPYFFVILAAWL